MATCKDFIKQRKTTYAAKFPFLTDSQITAKLKRIWSSSQGPGSVNELLPPTVGKTVHPRRKSRPIAQGSRVVSLARLSPKAIKENTDAAHSKDIPACTWTSDAGLRCDSPQTTSTPNTTFSSSKSPLLASSSLNTVAHSKPYHFSPDRLPIAGPKADSLSPSQRTRLKTTKKKQSNSQSKSIKQRESSPVEATPSSLFPSHLWSVTRYTRSKTAALLRGEVPPSELTTPTLAQSSPEESPTCEREGNEENRHLIGSEASSDEGGRVKSSSPHESFVECTTKSSEPVSPVESPPLSGPRDALCDMFSPLLPEECGSAPLHPGPPSSHHQDSVNEPARTLLGPGRGGEEEEAKYCLFENATDIFM